MTRIPTYDARELARQAEGAKQTVPTRIQIPVAQEARGIERLIPEALGRKAQADIEWNQQVLNIRQGVDLKNARRELDVGLRGLQEQMQDMDPTEWIYFVETNALSLVERTLDRNTRGAGLIRDQMKVELEGLVEGTLGQIQTKVLPESFKVAQLSLDQTQQELLAQVVTLGPGVLMERFTDEVEILDSQYTLPDRMVTSLINSMRSAAMRTYLQQMLIENPVELERQLLISNDPGQYSVNPESTEGQMRRFFATGLVSATAGAAWHERAKAEAVLKFRGDALGSHMTLYEHVGTDQLVVWGNEWLGVAPGTKDPVEFEADVRRFVGAQFAEQYGEYDNPNERVTRGLMNEERYKADKGSVESGDVTLVDAAKSIWAKEYGLWVGDLAKQAKERAFGRRSSPWWNVYEGLYPIYNSGRHVPPATTTP